MILLLFLKLINTLFANSIKNRETQWFKKLQMSKMCMYACMHEYSHSNLLIMYAGPYESIATFYNYYFEW